MVVLNEEERKQAIAADRDAQRYGKAEPDAYARFEIESLEAQKKRGLFIDDEALASLKVILEQRKADGVSVDEAGLVHNADGTVRTPDKAPPAPERAPVRGSVDPETGAYGYPADAPGAHEINRAINRDRSSQENGIPGPSDTELKIRAEGGGSVARETLAAREAEGRTVPEPHPAGSSEEAARVRDVQERAQAFGEQWTAKSEALAASERAAETPTQASQAESRQAGVNKTVVSDHKERQEPQRQRVATDAERETQDAWRRAQAEAQDARRAAGPESSGPVGVGGSDLPQSAATSKAAAEVPAPEAPAAAAPKAVSASVPETPPPVEPPPVTLREGSVAAEAVGGSMLAKGVGVAAALAVPALGGFNAAVKVHEQGGDGAAAGKAFAKGAGEAVGGVLVPNMDDVTGKKELTVADRTLNFLDKTFQATAVVGGAALQPEAVGVAGVGDAAVHATQFVLKETGLAGKDAGDGGAKSAWAAAKDAARSIAHVAKIFAEGDDAPGAMRHTGVPLPKPEAAASTPAPDPMTRTKEQTSSLASYAPPEELTSGSNVAPLPASKQQQQANATQAR